MQVHIETDLPVTPAVFWPRMFFDAGFNEGLHRELGFARYTLVAEQTRPDGVVERTLETEPPLYAPELVQRRLGHALRITEHGQFDPQSGLYSFTHTPALASGTTRIAGTIRVTPRALGLTHVVDVNVEVSAFGLGSLIERAIERGLRESYQKMARYTSAFAAQHELTAAG